MTFKKNIRLIWRLLVLFTFISSLHAQTNPGKTAFEVWNDLTEAGINFNENKVHVQGLEKEGNYIMFGAEKEGSSALLTRVMGPNKHGFKKWLSRLDEDSRKKFLKDFLDGMNSGKYRLGEVKNTKGEKIPLDLEHLKGVRFNELSLEELENKFDKFLENAGDKSFSHIKPQTRMNIFNGKFSGLNQTNSFKSLRTEIPIYQTFIPLWGEAEKYLDSVHHTSTGWEINFNPQKSYGEFEKMISWFKTSLKNNGVPFEAPGHQWVVMPKTTAELESKRKAIEVLDKLNEIHKNNQAYIVLKGLEGNTGIQYSNYKGVLDHDKFFESLEHLAKLDLETTDSRIKNLVDWELYQAHSTDRGPIRLQNDRFLVEENKSFNVEFRSGTKNDSTRRKTQKFLISRYATQELDDLAPGNSWSLNVSDIDDLEKLSKRFELPEETFELFFSKVYRDSNILLEPTYQVPFWNWEEAPYITEGKKEELKKLTQLYIKTIIKAENPSKEFIGNAIANWAKASNLSSDIENYLKPKQRLANPETAHLFPGKSNAPVDVNKIDLGIEYTGRFPLSTDADYVAIPGQNNKLEWRKTYLDYTPSERKDVIKKFAETLGKELNNGRAVEVVSSSSSDGHGHGIDISYDLRDDQGRKWRVEWDGVGRSYDTNGKVIPESLRGGHIEIVTPKFTPTKKDMDSLFEAMNKTDLIPSARMGGGHINIDLKPFEGNPKAMARFLGVYLDNRSMMSLLFQHPGRGVGAEPNRVTPNLISKLKNFNGTEEELKTLLYNEQFFNTRVGRKTKNNQLNLIAYFQDVIPEEFIHEDFDMKNDIWRRTFDVDPKIRKMEFRLFNAPINAAESALHIKYVRALLNKALNDTDPVFLGNYEVDYEKFAKDPEASMKEFEKHMKNLGLDPKEYRPFLLDGLELSKAHTESPKFLSTEEKLKPHPEIKDWKKAAPSRTNPIASAGRKWSGEGVEPEAKVYKENLQKGRVVAEAARKTKDPEGKLVKEITVSSSSIQTGAACSTPGEALNGLLQEL